MVKIACVIGERDTIGLAYSRQENLATFRDVDEQAFFQFSDTKSKSSNGQFELISIDNSEEILQSGNSVNFEPVG